MKVPLDELPPISPAFLFSFTGQIEKGKNLAKIKHPLPETLGETFFAHIEMAWHEGGLEVLIDSNEPITTVELFFNTRPHSGEQVVGRFCHHFRFTFQEEEVEKNEVTRFRTDETHLLADPRQLICEKLKTGVIRLTIEADILTGFDPQTHPHIGIGYRIKAASGACQTFPIPPEPINLEQHPTTWSTYEIH